MKFEEDKLMPETEKQIFADAYENDLRNAEYVKHLRKAIEYGRKIMELLGPNNLLFLEYERSACLAKEIRLRRAYRLGMEEGKLFFNAQRAQHLAQQNI